MKHKNMCDTELIKLYYQLRAYYKTHFENTWFYILLDGLPVDQILLRDIRDFVKIHEDWEMSDQRITKGIRDLEVFITTLRNYLLPYLKEKLRISYLKPETRVRDRDQLAIRRLMAYAIPITVRELANLAGRLKTQLNERTESTPEHTQMISDLTPQAAPA